MTTGVSYRRLDIDHCNRFCGMFYYYISGRRSLQGSRSNISHRTALLLDHRKGDDRVRIQHGVRAERDFYYYSVQQDDDGMGRRCFVNK